MTNSNPRFRSDETGRHAVPSSDSPAEKPAQGLDIETYDKKRSESPEPGQSGDDADHEKRPEGPYKDPSDETEQGKVK